MSAEPTNTPLSNEPQGSEATRALTPRPKDAPIGGQAVLEGVMMRGISTWAVAVPLPDGRGRTAEQPASNGAAPAHSNGATPTANGATASDPAALGEGWVE